MSLQVWRGHAASSSAPGLTVHKYHPHQQWNPGNECQVLNTWVRPGNCSWTRTRIKIRSRTRIRGNSAGCRTRSRTVGRQMVLKLPFCLFFTVKPAAATKWFLSAVITNVRTHIYRWIMLTWVSMVMMIGPLCVLACGVANDSRRMDQSADRTPDEGEVWFRWRMWPPNLQSDCFLLCLSLGAGRVVGGVNAAKGAWPWIVSLHWKLRHACGASVIGRDWLLTAAHCVYGWEKDDTIIIQIMQMKDL